MIRHGIEDFSKLDIKTILRANFQVSYNFGSNFYLGGVFTRPTYTPPPLPTPPLNESNVYKKAYE